MYVTTLGLAAFRYVIKLVQNTAIRNKNADRRNGYSA
jgi:hypothetical protein